MKTARNLPCNICGVLVKRVYTNMATYCSPCYEDINTDYIEDLVQPRHKYSADEDAEVNESMFDRIWKGG